MKLVGGYLSTFPVIHTMQYTSLNFSSLEISDLQILRVEYLSKSNS